jgi:hypothetical protein
MVHGNYAVVFHEGGAGKYRPFRVGINSIGKVAPMGKILADGVPPVLPGIFRRIGLVKKVPVTFPKA